MPPSDTILDPGLPAPAYRAFELVSSTRQFLVGGTVLLLLAMLAVLPASTLA